MTKRSFEAVEVVRDGRKLRPQFGSVTLSVVREHVFPIMADEDGSSIGQLVDQLIIQQLREHEGLIADLQVHLFPDQREGVAAFYMQD